MPTIYRRMRSPYFSINIVAGFANLPSLYRGRYTCSIHHCVRVCFLLWSSAGLDAVKPRLSLTTAALWPPPWKWYVIYPGRVIQRLVNWCWRKYLKFHRCGLNVAPNQMPECCNAVLHDVGRLLCCFNLTCFVLRSLPENYWITLVRRISLILVAIWLTSFWPCPGHQA